MIWSSDGIRRLCFTFLFLSTLKGVIGSHPPNDTNKDIEVQLFKIGVDVLNLAVHWDSKIASIYDARHVTWERNLEFLLAGEKDSPFLMADSLTFNGTLSLEMRLVADRLEHQNETTVESVVDARFAYDTTNNYKVTKVERVLDPVSLPDIIMKYISDSMTYPYNRLNVKFTVTNYEWKNTLSGTTSKDFFLYAYEVEKRFCDNFEGKYSPAPPCIVTKFINSYGKLTAYVSLGWDFLTQDPKINFVDFMNTSSVDGTVTKHALEIDFDSVMALSNDDTVTGYVDLLTFYNIRKKMYARYPAANPAIDPLMRNLYRAMMDPSSAFGSNRKKLQSDATEIEQRWNKNTDCETTGGDKYYILFDTDDNTLNQIPTPNFIMLQMPSKTHKIVVAGMQEAMEGFAEVLHGNDSYGMICVNGFSDITTTSARTNVTVVIKSAITSTLDVDVVKTEFKKKNLFHRINAVRGNTVKVYIDPFSLKPIQHFTSLTENHEEYQELDNDVRVDAVIKLTNFNYSSMYADMRSVEYFELRKKIQLAIVDKISPTGRKPGRVHQITQTEDGKIFVRMSIMVDHDGKDYRTEMVKKINSLVDSNAFGSGYVVDKTKTRAQEDHTLQGFIALWSQQKTEEDLKKALQEALTVEHHPHIYAVHADFMNKYSTRGAYFARTIKKFAVLDQAIGDSNSCIKQTASDKYSLSFRAQPVPMGSANNMKNIMKEESFAFRYFIGTAQPQLKSALKQNIHFNQSSKVCIHNITDLQGDNFLIQATVEFLPGWTQLYHVQDIEEGLAKAVNKSYIRSFKFVPFTSIKTSLKSRATADTNFNYGHFICIAIPVFVVATILIIVLLCLTKVYRSPNKEALPHHGNGMT